MYSVLYIEWCFCARVCVRVCVLQMIKFRICAVAADERSRMMISQCHRKMLYGDSETSTSRLKHAETLEDII